MNQYYDIGDIIGAIIIYIFMLYSMIGLLRYPTPLYTF